MERDPITSIIAFYTLSIPGIFLIYVVLGLSTQPGAQLPLLFITLCPFLLPIIVFLFCMYTLFFNKRWNRKDNRSMVIIAMCHLCAIIFLWKLYF
jgi:hypothetical protein